jgi:transcriptional regulator with XRE-family HTH domain
VIDPGHFPRLIGDRLRALRESRGMTHAHVSRVMGIARSNVCRLENGRHTPHLESIARFARACGYDLRDVLSCLTDVQDPGSIVGVEPSCSDIPGSAPVPPVAPTGEVALVGEPC